MSQAHPIVAIPSNHIEATIAAIATAPGTGGIGIIRISGPQALPILARIFRPHKAKLCQPGLQDLRSHRLYYGWAIHPVSHTPIDEVLAVYMRAPATYTREDVVEIHCHGSYLVLREILSHILTAGARAADPGEFTKRAFLNGRIDLTRAEAILDLIQAKTKKGLQLATAQLRGSLHEQVMAVRDALLALRAVIEVAIDFPEEEEDILDPVAIHKQLRDSVLQPLATMIATADRGKLFREGIFAVILGRPNVGKSSLLNTLLREERALVTEIPGTTRDTIEEYIDIKGMPVRLVDTAGIRETSETVEGLGVQRARAKMAEADLILFMVDASQPLMAEDLQLHAAAREHNSDSKIVVVLNKIDLAQHGEPQSMHDAFPGALRVAISAKKRTGIKTLEEAIFSVMTGDSVHWEEEASGAPNLRHRASLTKAREAVLRIETALRHGVLPDLVAIDLQDGLDHLGDIVGASTTDDVLDLIFDQFCIGK